jgi:hypothetical protein
VIFADDKGNYQSMLVKISDMSIINIFGDYFLDLCGEIPADSRSKTKIIDKIRGYLGIINDKTQSGSP